MFICVSRSHLQDCLEEILCRLSDLLVLNSPDNGLKCHLSAEDQLFIYETAGVFVVQSNFPPEVRKCVFAVFFVLEVILFII